MLFCFDKSLFSCFHLPSVEEIELLKINLFIRNSYLTTEFRYTFLSSCWFAVYCLYWLKKKSFLECFHLPNQAVAVFLVSYPRGNIFSKYRTAIYSSLFWFQGIFLNKTMAEFQSVAACHISLFDNYLW